jgi:hypothetical protein
MVITAAMIQLHWMNEINQKSRYLEETVLHIKSSASNIFHEILENSTTIDSSLFFTMLINKRNSNLHTSRSLKCHMLLD